MQKFMIATTLAALVAAGSAFAENRQLSRAVNVPEDAYSVAEMVKIWAWGQEDRQRGRALELIDSKKAGGSAVARSAASPVGLAPQE